MVCGAEPLNPAVLKQFLDLFCPLGVAPDGFGCCYGLAENTLIAAYTSGRNMVHVDKAALEERKVVVLHKQKFNEEKAEIEGASALISSGFAPEKGTKIMIVNPETCEICGPDEVRIFIYIIYSHH
jgi:acyl-CoA synthetase (AMP-forming)/AMP-acid ligase II